MEEIDQTLFSISSLQNRKRLAEPIKDSTYQVRTWGGHLFTAQIFSIQPPTQLFYIIGDILLNHVQPPIELLTTGDISLNSRLPDQLLRAVGGYRFIRAIPPYYFMKCSALHIYMRTPR